MNTEEIAIRPVQDEDFPAITEIYNYYVLKGEQSFETEAVTAEEMQQRAFIITIDSHYLVAVSGGTILGFCYAHKWKERAAYSNTLETTIYLSKDARHRGVGKLLMERLIESCRQAGYRVLIACITGNNTESIEFHKSLGFTQASHFHNVGFKHGKWLDVVDLELQLQ